MSAPCEMMPCCWFATCFENAEVKNFFVVTPDEPHREIVSPSFGMNGAVHPSSHREAIRFIAHRLL